MKGQISILEMIITVIALLVAFNIFFPGFQYKSKWSESLILLNGRDVVLTIDRLGKLYDCSFSENTLQNFLDQILLPSIVPWSEIEGTIKDTVVIACNCTDEQMNMLNSWMDGLKFNGRYVDKRICYTNLDNLVNYCEDPDHTKHAVDVLVIWGYKDLSDPIYTKILQEFLRNDNGIVEIMDFDSALKVDDTQKKIFGLSWLGGDWGLSNNNIFFKPENASKITYQSYKFFYHIPVVLNAPNPVSSLPVEGTTQPCGSTNVNQGKFTFREDIYQFWICNGQSVYFDTTNTNTADLIVRAKENFVINNYNFYLSYIDGNSKIGVAFKPNYDFIDFVQDGNSKLYPIDQNIRRILLNNGDYSGSNNPIPVVVLNGSTGRTAWIADFSRNPVEIGDDHKQLFLSLLLWSSNKRAVGILSPNLNVGYLTSYVNTVNDDMFEVYKFGLGLGYPF